MSSSGRFFEEKIIDDHGISTLQGKWETNLGSKGMVKLKKVPPPQAEKIAKIVSWNEFKERYAIEIQQVGFDQNHVHILNRFLPKYSGGEVIRLIKSITAREIFREVPEVKRQLWGGEFWTDGYYIATISRRGG